MSRWLTCTNMGYLFIERAKYSNASDVAMCLCMLNPFIAGFWRLLGLSQEGEKDYRAAVMSYAVALERDDDLDPAIFTARCLGHLGHRAEALAVLDQAVALAQKSSASDHFYKQVKELRALLV